MVEYSYRVKRGASFVWYVQAAWRVTVQADSVGWPTLMNGKPFPSSSDMDHVQAGFETRMCGVCIGGGDKTLPSERLSAKADR